MRLPRPTWFALLPLTVLVGCQEAEGPATYETTGVVTLSGEAVQGAVLFFQPVAGAGKPAQATTDAAGMFEVHTAIETNVTKPGMVPGDYRVTVTKLDTSNVTSTLTPPKNMLPAKYANLGTSELNATVSADGENHFEFALE